MSKKLNSAPLWAIVGQYGMYFDTFRTRKQAIMYHAWCIQDAGDNIPEHAREMTDAHRKSWQRCKRRGDRCVRVNIYMAA